MKFNDAGLLILKLFESCKLTAYQDQKGIWTIGYGCTHHIRPNETITQEEADSRLREDLQWTIDTVAAIIKPHELNDNQFSAIVSLVYNIGVVDFRSSTLLNCIKMGHPDDAANEFERWDKVNGIPSDGVLRRRKSERALFITAT